MSEGTITINKNDLWKYSTFLLAALVIVLVIVMISGNDNGTVTGNVVANNPTPSVPTQPATVSASADDDAVFGDLDKADVVIVEFSDFQCPFCSRALPTLDQIKSTYGDKVAIVYRDLPLNSIHPQAQKAAEAAECVREQGGDDAFWEYHDKLFANQQTLSVDNYKAWAQEMGFNIASCLDSNKFANEVAKDSQDGSAATCTGTPCFIVVNSEGKGQKVNGAVPFEQFKPVIDAALA